MGVGAFLPSFLLELALGDDPVGPALFPLGLVVQTFAWSFTALTSALLYLDLRARRRIHLSEAAPAKP